MDRKGFRKEEGFSQPLGTTYRKHIEEDTRGKGCTMDESMASAPPQPNQINKIQKQSVSPCRGNP